MISIEKYIAQNNTVGAQSLLAKYGMGVGKSWDDLHAKLRNILATYKDQAAQDMAAIDTPYKRLIEASMVPTVVEKQVVVAAPVETKRSNADGGCGCGGNCGEKMQREPLPSPFSYSRADGSVATNDNLKYMPHITIAVLAFLLGYEIAKHK